MIIWNDKDGSCLSDCWGSFNSADGVKWKEIVFYQEDIYQLTALQSSDLWTNQCHQWKQSRSGNEEVNQVQTQDVHKMIPSLNF